MNRMADNVILLVLASFMVFGVPDMVRPVLALLFAVIAAALGIYFSDTKRWAAVCILFVVICFFLPELTFFLPVIFYHNYRFHSRWAVLCGLPFLAEVFSCGIWEIALWIVLCCLAILLAERAEKTEKLEYDMIRIRDSSTELNLALKEKNRTLMEKQDYEIYLATLRERNRIAREIHDNVGHMLSRSILQVGALGTIHKEEPLHEQLTSINATLNQAMNSIRESVHDLHDDSVDLKQAVLDVTKDMRENYQIKIDYDMTRAVPKNVKYCFITTLKEAMSNIVKHSNADKITVILREHPGFYQLSIEDNGTKKSVVSGDGIGLSNMKERVDALHGTFRIQSDNGFKIFISIKKAED